MMLDDLLAIGRAFDWISPVSAWVQDIVRGPAHSFLVPVSCGLSGRQLAGALRRSRIDSWGWMVVGGWFLFSVHRSDAARARRVLARLGVDLG